MTNLTCWPLDNHEYTAEALGATYAARSRGVLNATDFAATTNGDNTLTLAAGAAVIKRADFWSATAYSLNPTTLQFSDADGSFDRYDVVALTHDKNANETGLQVIEGTASASPVYPTIRRNDDYDEIFLFAVLRTAGATTITASAITDLRQNQTYCGLMRDTLDAVDTSVIEAAFEQKLKEQDATLETFMATSESEFTVWFNKMKDQLSTDAAGKLQTEIETEATERGKADTYLQDNIDAVANVYAATLLLDDWDELSDSSGYAYKQQAQIVAEESGKQPVTSDSVFLTPCYFTPTGVQATDESLSEALAIINAGYTTSGSGTVTVLVAEKPACDITVKWTIQA